MLQGKIPMNKILESRLNTIYIITFPSALVRVDLNSYIILLVLIKY